MRSVPAIAFDYRPSRWLFAALVLAATLALLAVAMSGLALQMKLAIALAAVTYASWALRRFVLAPFDRVTWHAAGHWRLRGADEEERGGELVTATTLGAFIVLRLRVGPKRVVSLPLLFDNCERETRRVLRVRLSRGDGDA